MTTQAKLERVEKDLNSLARKILHVIPTDEAVDKKRALVLCGQNGIAKSQSVLIGCIDNLVRHGLVREEPKGHFYRVKPKPPAQKTLGDAITTVANHGSRAKPILTLPKDEKMPKTKEPRDPMEIIIELRDLFEQAMYEIGEYYEREKTKHAADMKRLQHFKKFMESMKETGE